MLGNNSQEQVSLEDIESNEVKKLADRLKGDFDKETLSNILEWQDRNLSFWWERWPLERYFKSLTAVILCLFLFVSLPFLLLAYTYASGLLLPSLAGLAIAFTVVMLALSDALSKLIYLFLSLSVVYPTLIFAFRSPGITNEALFYTLFYGGCLGAVTLIFLYLVSRYRHYLTENSWWENLNKLKEMINNTFRVSLPVETILDYRLAVCRDYAKLTASLLFNLYPNSEICLFTIPDHVAAAIGVNDEYYVLDQRLPVLTKDRWLESQDEEEADVEALDWNEDEKELTVKQDEKIVLSEGTHEPVDSGELTERVAQELGIEQETDGKKLFEKTLENYADIYENDEIVEYSMTRAIKNKISDEISENIDKVTKVEIEQNEEDLILKVYTREESST